MTHDDDPLLPAQRVYAMAVNAANRKYNDALKKAHAERAAEVAEALETCQLAMEATDDQVG